MKNHKAFQPVCLLILFVFIGGKFSFATKSANAVYANNVDVANYGAIPDDAIDDTQAIKNAIAACDPAGSTLNFSQGVYLVDAPFSFGYYTNFTINGNNATFSCRNWNIVFYFYSSKNITISNMTFDWDRDLPFSYGTVVTKANGYVDVSLPAPQVARAGLRSEAIIQYDPSLSQNMAGGFDYYENGLPLSQIVSSNVMRCYTNGYFNMPVGTNIVVRHQVYGGNIFHLNDVQGINISNILVYSAPGMGMVTQNSSDVTISNFQIKKFPGRWMSTCADGIHLVSTRGSVSVTGCYLQGMGDDGMNVRGVYSKINYVTANAICLTNPYNNTAIAPYETPDPGDSVVFIDPSNMAIKGKSMVVSFTADNANNCQLVTLTTIPASVVAGDLIYDLNEAGSLTLSGTTVEQNRGRGLVLQTPNSTVSNCTFNKCSGPGLIAYSCAGSPFYESSPPHNSVIKNCTFTNCNYASYFFGTPALWLLAQTPGFQSAVPGTIYDVEIKNNQFQCLNDTPPIVITSSDKIYLDGNTYSSNITQQIDYFNNTNDYCEIYVNRKLPTAATPFGGVATVLPAKIEAEDFDQGGEGVGYHDVTVANQGGSAYRNEQVDVYDIGSGEKAINYTLCSEWLGYTVNVPQAGYYDITVRGSTTVNGAYVRIEKELVPITPLVEFPITGSFTNYQDYTISNVLLPQGTYQLKFVFEGISIGFDYLNFVFKSIPTVTGPSLRNSNITISPNPAQSSLCVNSVNGSFAVKEIQIKNELGQVVFSDNTINNVISHIDIGGLLNGIYFLEIITSNGERGNYRFVKN